MTYHNRIDWDKIDPKTLSELDKTIEMFTDKTDEYRSAVPGKKGGEAAGTGTGGTGHGPVRSLGETAEPVTTETEGSAVPVAAGDPSPAQDTTEAPTAGETPPPVQGTATEAGETAPPVQGTASESGEAQPENGGSNLLGDPVWFTGKNIDEVAFCEEYLKKHPMKCIHKYLYDIDGKVNEEKLENDIYNAIKPYAVTGVARTVTRLTDALKHAAFSEALPPDEDRIHFANGIYDLRDRSFTPESEICLNRLPVAYVPDAPSPAVWLKFLDELLYPEDIPALQEFMGYSFIPTNRAQVMMVIIGNGGEGKSRIALVLRALHGDNMNLYSIQKLASDKFARADQLGKLLMVDDDMKTDALPDTGILKTIVTLEDKYDLEQKNRQSFQAELYVRILALGNGALSSLYDRSEGFYRRQLVLQVKPKPEDRVDDRTLIDKLTAESEGIMLWCLEGLHRLIGNGFEFSVSERMKKNLEQIRRSDNNIEEFFESTGYIRFEEGTCATTRQLYGAYRRWCDDSLEKPLAERTFAVQLRRSEEKRHIKYDTNIFLPGGKKTRGYHGVHVLNSGIGYRTFTDT